MGAAGGAGWGPGGVAGKGRRTVRNPARLARGAGAAVASPGIGPGGGGGARRPLPISADARDGSGRTLGSGLRPGRASVSKFPPSGRARGRQLVFVRRIRWFSSPSSNPFSFPPLNLSLSTK